MNQSTEEKRRHERHSVKALCFVRLSSKKRKQQVIGSLADISASGLAFTFLPEEKNKKHRPRSKETYRLDLFQSDDSSLLLSDVPAQLKYLQQRKEPPSFLGMPLTRCGVEFLNLSAGQEEELKEFLTM